MSTAENSNFVTLEQRTAKSKFWLQNKGMKETFQLLKFRTAEMWPSDQSEESLFRWSLNQILPKVNKAKFNKLQILQSKTVQQDFKLEVRIKV